MLFLLVAVGVLTAINVHHRLGQMQEIKTIKFEKPSTVGFTDTKISCFAEFNIPLLEKHLIALKHLIGFITFDESNYCNCKRLCLSQNHLLRVD